jgi:hypothetical protein
MRWLSIALVGGTLLVGCAHHKSDQPSGPAAAKKPKPAAAAKSAKAGAPVLSVTNGATVITLADPMTGKVVLVNPVLRTVVLNYSLHRLPAIDQRLSVYRKGAEVGEVKISGPELNNNIVADIIAGEVQVGDDVRKK